MKSTIITLILSVFFAMNINAQTCSDQGVIGKSHSVPGLPQYLNTYKKTHDLSAYVIHSPEYRTVVWIATSTFTGPITDQTSNQPIIIGTVDFNTNDKIVSYMYGTVAVIIE